MRPQCIVFDEPTAMLDPSGRQEVMEVIRKLSQEGITIVLITHFMEEAAQADRIIIMEKGEIAMDGTPVDVFRNIDALKRLSLDVPFAVDMAERLRAGGLAVPYEIIATEELVAYLSQSV